MIAYMGITRVGDTYICENITTDVEKVTKMVDAYNQVEKVFRDGKENLL